MKNDDLMEIMECARALRSSLAVPVLLYHGEALKLIVADLAAKYHHNAQRGDAEWTPIFEKVLSYYLSPDELEAILQANDQDDSQSLPPCSASSVLAEIEAEIARATAKFPTWPTDPIHAFAVVGEEYGECQKEVLQLTYEPHKSSKEEVRKEAVQLAAMAIRFLMSLDRYEYTQGPQHSQQNSQEQPPT